MKLIDVNPDNVMEHGLFCLKDKSSPGFKKKLAWYQKRFKEGLKFRMLLADDGKAAGFIEYIPSEFAWRPVQVNNYLFVHCIMIYPNKYKGLNYGSLLVESCIKEARNTGKDGVAVVTSDGAFIANSQLFLKLGFKLVDKKDRFELLAYILSDGPKPKFYDWQKQLPEYKGWHLLYADQCPWHEKAVNSLAQAAEVHGISLKVKKITSAKAAQQAPTGYGVFNLIKDGSVLADHYISETRFKNILKQQLVV